MAQGDQLTAARKRRRNRGRGCADPNGAFAVAWHLVWAAAIAVAAALLVLLGRLASGVELYALGAMAAAALVGALLGATQEEAGKTAAVMVWALAAVAASQISGGAGGPLAVWCLAPLAAAVLFGGLRRLAFGAAAAFAVGALAALGSVLLPLPEPAAWTRPWLSLLALATLAIAIGAALLQRQGEIVRASAGREAAERKLIEALQQKEVERLRLSDLEQALESAQAQNQGKSRFLANMSHELRTPLNAIMGFSDIMRQRLFGPVADRYAEYAELIHESGSHLLELINDVLDMSKIEAERFELAKESFDAREAISAVLRLMRGQADRAGVNLRAVLPRQPLEADADRRAVKQIAINLIANALKFTPRGGAVTVSLSGEGKMLELSVSDTGVGIAADDLERLGRPFEQAGDAGQRKAGAGLGLSLVRAFARLHGGDMMLESVVGSGTTVTVRIPVLIPPRPSQVAAAAEG